MTFSVEQYNGRDHLIHRVSDSTKTDPLLLGMLLNNHIPGFGQFSMGNGESEQILRYDIQDMCSMKEVFSTEVSRRTLLKSFDAILAAMEIAQDYMIDSSAIVLDTEHIYLNPSNFNMALICLPLMDFQNGIDEKSFFKSIMFNTIFDYSEPCDHVARIMNYLNGAEFNPRDFRQLLSELNTDSSNTEETPNKESDPFFGFDFSAPSDAEEPPSEETDPFFGFDFSAPSDAAKAPSKATDPFSGFDFSAPSNVEDTSNEKTDPFSGFDFSAPSNVEDTPSEETDPFFGFDFSAPSKPEPKDNSLHSGTKIQNSPLQQADDILSSALQQAETKNRNQNEFEPENQQVFNWDFELPNVKKDTDAADPLSIADQLLSAALNSEPVAQTVESPMADLPSAPEIPKADVLSAPAKAPEFSAGGSVRSRRSRARRESQDPQASTIPSREIAERPSPVLHSPEKESTASSDPFDFLGSFTSSADSKKTDAMKAADAILSALDVAPKEPPKEEPGLDIFAGFFPVKQTEPSKDEEVADDSFSDFSTPRVSSRKKNTSSETVKNPLPKAQETAGPSTKKPKSEEIVFTFSSNIPKNSAASDASKIADDLLSAAIASSSQDRSVAATENSAPFTFVTEKPKNSEAMAAAETLLADFGKPQPKKESPAKGNTISDPFSQFSSPSKKTAAMLEAEAILDALDFSVPVAEETSSSGSTHKDTSSSYSAPSPSSEHTNKQEPASQVPPRKGGFFSKLRKKEEPVPPPEPPVQQVIPYFGNEGETTVLNVAQQMMKPADPYLVRSSNQETIFLSKSVFRIGKDRDFVDYCICDNSAISRRHANFIIRNGDIFVIDTNSTNHTYVNGVMIRSNVEVKLTHGDEIRLANEDFMLYCASTL